MTLSYPIKLNDEYPCQGVDAEGKAVGFTDLLYEGDQVGPCDPDLDEGEAMYIDAEVVLKEDGLWVIEL